VTAEPDKEQTNAQGYQIDEMDTTRHPALLKP